jgi:hypothetical protein
MPDNIIPDSLYPVMERPHFESQIPEHLLKDVSESDKFVMSSLSKLLQESDWTIEAMLLTHDQLRHTNGRLVRAENQIETAKSNWGALNKGWRGFVALVVYLYQALHGNPGATPPPH